MQRREILAFLFTFLTGCFVGFYAYFAGYSPVAREVGDSVESWVGELSVVGEVYGGCRDACPRFRVASDGSYRYFYKPINASDQVLRDGELPNQLIVRLRRTLTEQNLTNASQTITPAFCESFADGVDIRYTITLNDTEYIVDSCGTSVAGDGAVWTSLSQVWNFFETGS